MKRITKDCKNKLEINSENSNEGTYITREYKIYW